MGSLVGRVCVLASEHSTNVFLTTIDSSLQKNDVLCCSCPTTASAVQGLNFHGQGRFGARFNVNWFTLY